jgi:hypothetical protein
VQENGGWWHGLCHLCGYVQQVPRRSHQPVQARHDQHIARIEPAEKLGQLGAVGLSSARLLTVHLGTARGFQLPSSALPPYMRDLITPADYGFSRIAMVGAVLRPFPAGALPRQLPSVLQDEKKMEPELDAIGKELEKLENRICRGC